MRATRLEQEGRQHLEAKQHGRSNERHQISEETTMNAKKEREREREREGRINCFSAKAIGGGNEASCSVDMDREGGRKEEGAMIVHNGSTTAEGDSPPPAVRPSGPTQQAIRTRGREREGGGVGFASTQHTYRIPAPRAVCSVRRCLLPPAVLPSPPAAAPHTTYATCEPSADAARSVGLQRTLWSSDTAQHTYERAQRTC